MAIWRAREFAIGELDALDALDKTRSARDERSFPHSRLATARYANPALACDASLHFYCDDGEQVKP